MIKSYFEFVKLLNEQMNIFQCRRGGCTLRFSDIAERYAHESMCELGQDGPTRATTKEEKAKKWQGD